MKNPTVFISYSWDNSRHKEWVISLANEFSGGVGYETSLLINNMVENINKIIPIMRFVGDKSKAISYYLKGPTYIDFTNDLDFDEVDD